MAIALSTSPYTVRCLGHELKTVNCNASHIRGDVANCEIEADLSSLPPDVLSALLANPAQAQLLYNGEVVKDVPMMATINAPAAGRPITVAFRFWWRTETTLPDLPLSRAELEDERRSMYP